MKTLLFALSAWLAPETHSTAVRLHPHILDKGEIVDIVQAASAEEEVPVVSAPRFAPQPMRSDDDAVLRMRVEAMVASLPICRRGDADGPGLARILFASNGSVEVSLSAPYVGTSTGACIARRLARAAVPRNGEPLAITVRFSI